MNAIARRAARLANQLLNRAEPPLCDTCIFVEFFRSNGDGQMTRLNAFCRCPDGLFENHPVPKARRCEHWQRAEKSAVRPTVGDPTLTA